MSRYHIALVSPDPGLRLTMERVTADAACQAQLADDEDESEIDTGTLIDLVIIDARNRDPGETFLRKLGPRARTIYLVAPGALLGSVDLLRSQQSTSLLAYSAELDDDVLVQATTKVLRSELARLPSYLPGGATTGAALVASYEEKRAAIKTIVEGAQLAGVRAPIRQRIRHVADELMTNALYHAPTDDKGNPRYDHRSPRDLAQLGDMDPIEFRYGHQGSCFGISVSDGFGSLRRERALDYLHRAGCTESKVESKSSGAGLGLTSVLKSASSLIFNLDPGHSTEAIALFDTQGPSKGGPGAHSLHLFTQ